MQVKRVYMPGLIWAIETRFFVLNFSLSILPRYVISREALSQEQFPHCSDDSALLSKFLLFPIFERS